MTDVKRPSILRPTADTPFHIDFDWWQANDRDWRVYLNALLCAEHQAMFADWQDGQSFDWIDPRTAEVKPVDGIQHILMSHCARQPEFLNQHTALVEAVFRLFLINGNQPMSSANLAERLNRPQDTILKTLTGARIYRGLRPCL